MGKKTAEEFVEPPRLASVDTKLDSSVRLLLEKLSQASGVPIHELSSRTIVIREGQVTILDAEA